MSVSRPHLYLRAKAAAVSNRLGPRARIGLAVLVLTPTLSAAVSVATPMRALAYICNGGATKTAYGPNGAYDQLNYNWSSCGYIHYNGYTLNGWSNVSWLSVNNLRTWVCGNWTQFNQSYTLYNTNYVQYGSPTYFNGNCGPQADMTGAEGVNGQWGWSAYLNW